MNLVEVKRLQPVSWDSLRLELLDARVELVAQLSGIDRRTDGDNLRARRPLPPLIQFRYLRATSDDLEGDPLVRRVSGKASGSGFSEKAQHGP